MRFTVKITNTLKCKPFAYTIFQLFVFENNKSSGVPVENIW